MRKTFIQEVEKLTENDQSVYVISGDAGFGVFENYQSQYPDQFINAGIAEANTIGYAAGLAVTGYNVFVYNIIPFVLYRCYEQVRNDLCYQKLPVTLIGIGSGLTYAPGGMTHYSVEDLAICQSLPNLTVISPSDPAETRAAVSYAYNAIEPVYIRIAKNGEPEIRKDACTDILSPFVVKDGEKIAIIGYGSILKEALDAVDRLNSDGINPKLISVPTIQPFPGDSLFKLLDGCQKVYILEEHFRSGGLTTRFADYLVNNGKTIEVESLSIPDHYIHDINNQDSIRAKFGMNAPAVEHKVRQHFKQEQTNAI